MKKIVTLLLALCMVCSMAACGTGSKPAETAEPAADSNSGKTVINVWTHANGPWDAANVKTEAAFEAAYPEYDVVYTTFPYGDFQSKIQTSLMSSEHPDVYEVWGGWAPDFIDAGALAEVPAELSANFTDYYEPTLGSYSKDGKFYGVPEEFNLEFGVLFVNKKLFEENGFSYPTTWEEMNEISEKVSVKDGDSMVMRGYDIVNIDAMLHFWLSNILSLGGTYYTDADGFNFNTPEAIQVMEELKGQIDKGYSNLDGILGIDGADVFFKDQAYMMTKGVWCMSKGINDFGKVYGEDFEIMAQPAYIEPAIATAETGWGLVVPEKCENKDAAWKYIEFCSEQDNLMQHNVECGQIPPRKSIATSAEYLEQAPYMEGILPTLESGRYIGRFNTEILKDNFKNMFTDLCTGGRETVEVLTEFTDLMNAEIQ